MRPRPHRRPVPTLITSVLVSLAAFFLVFRVLGVAAAGVRPALLVLSKTGNELARVDPATLKVVARAPTGNSPHEVAVSADGKTAFVSNYGAQTPGSTLSVIDLVAMKELRRVELGNLRRPHGIAVVGGKVYFTAEANQAVARYDPTSDRVDQVIETGQQGTHMLAVAPDSSRIYTANIGSDTVSVIDRLPAQNAPRVSRVSVGDAPEGITISPDGREVWVGQNGDGGIAILDTASNRVKETIRVGGVPIRVQFTPDGKRVLVSNAQGGEVVILDAASRKETKRLPVGGTPVGILVTPDGKRAFVATTGANRVAILDLEALSVTGSLDAGAHPDGMAWIAGNAS